MTELFVFDREGVTLPETAALLLPEWRRVRRDALKNEKAREESLAAGLLFAAAMKRRGLTDGELERVTLLPAGKPVLADRDDVWFSLSHSGRYVLCAVSGRPVGADVQQVRQTRRSLTRWFHPAEQAWLSSLAENERDAALFRLWTRKEAWVKAVSGERMLSLSEADVIHDLPGLCFRDYALPGGYAAALCGGMGPLPGMTAISREELLAERRD